MTSKKQNVARKDDGDEEYDGEFMFDADSPEFLAVYALAKQWLAAKNVRFISNATEGEILATQFQQFVETEHADVATRVRRDAGIYDSVLLSWNDEQDFEEDDDDDDDDDDLNT